MSSKAQRWLLAVGIAASLLVASTSLLGEEADSAPGQKPLNYEGLLKKEASILEALNELDEDLALRERELDTIQDQRQRVAVELIALEVKFENQTARLRNTRMTIRKRLRSILHARRYQQTQLVMAPEDAFERSLRGRVLEQLLDADKARIEAYRRELEAWQSERDRLSSQRDKLDGLESQVANLRDGLEADRLQRHGIMERVRSDRRFYEKAHRDADRAHGELTGRIDKLEAWRDKKLRFRSLKGKFRLPMSYAKVVTPFGPRKNKKLGTTTVHRGFEIASDGSIKVRAIYWGRVAFVGWLLGYGNTVILDHTEGYHTVYARLKKVTAKEGEVVESREVLGTVGGATALGTAGTLFFELRENGKAVDPAPWFSR